MIFEYSFVMGKENPKKKSLNRAANRDGAYKLSFKQ